MTNNSNKPTTLGFLAPVLLYLAIAGCHVAQALAPTLEVTEVVAAVLYVGLAVSCLPPWGRH